MFSAIQATDKPQVENPACLMHPFVAYSDEAADRMRKYIRSLPSAVPTGGRQWYIAPEGHDNNSGASPQEAWATPTALHIHDEDIQAGDAVLFARGGVYRGSIVAKSGVYYGAYGEGDKPCLYVSRCNYAKREWTETTPYHWEITLPDSGDVGHVVFNHGEVVGVKRRPTEKLVYDLDFQYENHVLRLFSTRNPAQRYWSIEIGDLVHNVLIPVDTHDVTVENLTLKYGGGHGVVALNGSKNITVRGCEIGFIGGSYLPGHGEGFTRFGNGVEFWQGCDTALVEDCWLYQIYDSGLSHQGRDVFEAKNITFRRNLVEYTSFASIEYWMSDGDGETIARHVRYTNNILRFAGYGWGELWRPFTHAYHILATGDDAPHPCEDFLIENNILDLSARCLVRCRSSLGTVPVLKGNTYYQRRNGLLGGYKDSIKPLARFDNDAEETLKTTFGDTTATLRFYDGP